jgi:hypothetical protein
MANLNPTNVITYPLNWEAKSIEITVNAFPLFPQTVEVFWKLIGDSNSFSGSTQIPNSVVSQWGTDDAVIQSYVLNQLGLSEALTPIVVEAPVIINETPSEEETTEEPIV